MDQLDKPEIKEQNEEPQNTIDEDTITKPKRTRRMSEETRKKMADHMRIINQERIEKARLKNTNELAMKEQRLKERLKEVEDKKNSVGKPRLSKSEKELKEIESSTIIDPLTPTFEKSSKKQYKKKTKKIIIDETSSDDDSSSSDDAEYIYIKNNKKMTKPKNKKPVIEEPPKPPSKPPMIIKFI